jgi:hypothetical protein
MLLLDVDDGKYDVLGPTGGVPIDAKLFTDPEPRRN